MNENLKFGLLSFSNLCALVVIVTTLVSGTDVFDFTDVTISGTVTVEGECYYNGSVGCVPSGTTLLFNQACPSGWTRQAGYDGRYLLFSSTPGTNGGTSTHDHTWNHVHSEAISDTSTSDPHTHTVSDSLNAVGDHTHTGCWLCSPYTGSATGGLGFSRYNTATTSASGGHSHSSITGTTGTNTDTGHTHTESGTSGSASPNLVAANNAPPYLEIVICTKD